MRALSVNGENQELKEIDIELQANTVYTFFNSIAIDEFNIINKHIIYSDSNALEQKKTPYFIAEQLVLGDSLILGHENMIDDEATIPLAKLESLINYDVSEFYKEVLNLIADSEINIYSAFEIRHKEENIQLNTEWLLHTFNMADDKTKEYFIDELKKVVGDKAKVEEHIYKMTGLALRAIE